MSYHSTEPAIGTITGGGRCIDDDGPCNGCGYCRDMAVVDDGEAAEHAGDIKRAAERDDELLREREGGGE